MSEPYDALLNAPRRDLERLLAGGHPLAPEALAGHRYRGIALATPYPLDRLVKKFVKVFHADPGADGVRGWNARVRQDGLHAPWTEARLAGQPLVFGHFAVIAPGAPGRDDPYPKALLLDYGRGERPCSPLAPVRDYVAAIDYGRPELLIGRMFLALGPWRVPTPSYFLLLRDRPLDRVFAPPRRRT